MLPIILLKMLLLSTKIANTNPATGGKNSLVKSWEVVLEKKKKKHRSRLAAMVGAEVLDFSKPCSWLGVIGSVSVFEIIFKYFLKVNLYEKNIKFILFIVFILGQK